MDDIPHFGCFPVFYSNTASVTEACVHCREEKQTVNRCYSIFHLMKISVANYIAPTADE